MPTPPPSFCLHVGAHKTATTHLQNSLAAMAPDLAAAGVMFYGPRDFRWGKPTLQARFSIGNRPQDQTALADPDALPDLLGQGRRLVISEENFAGTLLNAAGKIRNPLYPDLPRRLAVLSARSRPIDVLLSIRNPVSLLNSAFSQLLLSDQAMPLDSYLTQNPIVRVDWVDLARRIAQTDGVRTLTIWQHEDYGPLFPRIVRRMIGPDAPSVRPLRGRMHQSLSATAVNAVLNDGMSAKEALDQFPVGAAHAPFDAFDGDAHALSDDYYAAQLTALDDLPRTRRLTPT